MPENNFERLGNTTNAEIQKDLEALGRLTLEQVRNLVHDHIDLDDTIALSARCLIEILGGQSMATITAVGASLIMASLELTAKDITVMPTAQQIVDSQIEPSADAEGKEKANE